MPDAHSVPSEEPDEPVHGPPSSAEAAFLASCAAGQFDDAARILWRELADIRFRRSLKRILSGVIDDVADVQSAAVWRAITAWTTFRGGAQGGLRAWVQSIARNLALDAVRKAAPRSVDPESFETSGATRELDPAKWLPVYEALTMLPERLRESLFCYPDPPTATGLGAQANRLGISVQTLYNRRREALAFLRRVLDGEPGSRA